MVFIDARSTLHPIHSESTGLTGFFEGDVDVEGLLDLSVPPRASLEMRIALLSSGNPLYDREMKRRVDAKRFPAITAELTDMKPAGAAGRYTTEGDVTFRGVTQRVTDELVVSVPDAGTIVFQGEHDFNLPDFGMEPPKIMMLKVHPDVKIRVHIVAKAG
jgi:polyisoprenoid-binding protein YceI